MIAHFNPTCLSYHMPFTNKGRVWNIPVTTIADQRLAYLPTEDNVTFAYFIGVMEPKLPYVIEDFRDTKFFKGSSPDMRDFLFINEYIGSLPEGKTPKLLVIEFSTFSQAEFYLLELYQRPFIVMSDYSNNSVLKNKWHQLSQTVIPRKASFVTRDN